MEVPILALFHPEVNLILHSYPHPIIIHLTPLHLKVKDIIYTGPHPIHQIELYLFEPTTIRQTTLHPCIRLMSGNLSIAIVLAATIELIMGFTQTLLLIGIYSIALSTSSLN